MNSFNTITRTHTTGGLDGDRQSVLPFSATDARARLSAATHRRGSDINYRLTMRRLYKIIENTAANGFDTLTFTAPSVILDGSVCDPIVLAKQVKVRLVELGYRVKRSQDVLVISWGTQKTGSSKKKQAPPVLQLEKDANN